MSAGWLHADRGRLPLEGPSASGFGGGSGYRPDLDGLRAIAVGLVILTHAQWPWRNNGGDAGVTAFFVLSGYVITRLLLRQHAEGRADVLGFYRRRLVRLGPALLALLAFTLVTGILIGWPTQWRLGIVSCLLYVSNWVQVAGINIDPLGHTWSLAIEEQFYLLWPALLFGLIARRRDWLIPATIVLIVLGSLIRVESSGLFEYFSTFTRADAILLGCLVALTGIRLPSWTAAAGLAGLVAVALLLAPENHALAIPLSMFAAAAVIGWGVQAALAARPGGPACVQPVPLELAHGAVVRCHPGASGRAHRPGRRLARRSACSRRLSFGAAASGRMPASLEHRHERLGAGRVIAP